MIGALAWLVLGVCWSVVLVLALLVLALRDDFF